MKNTLKPEHGAPRCSGLQDDEEAEKRGLRNSQQRKPSKERASKRRMWPTCHLLLQNVEDCPWGLAAQRWKKSGPLIREVLVEWDQEENASPNKR